MTHRESKKVHVMALQEEYLGFLTGYTYSSLIITARSYGDFSSWCWNPWAMGPGVGLGTLDPQGVLAAKITLLIFNHPTGCGTSPFCVSSPPASLMRLLYNFSCRTSFQVDFRQSE